MVPTEEPDSQFRSAKRIAELTAKAEQGNAYAQYALGKAYWDEYERSYASEHEEAAEKWFLRAAEQGHREAQYLLAKIHQWDTVGLDFF